MNDYLTRCNWCETRQDGNLSDLCATCGKQGYMMDYREKAEA